MIRKTRASVADTQASPLAVTIEVSGHRLIGDEPVVQGGADMGPSPYDLLTASLGACTAMTVRWYALKMGWPLEHVHVEVEHEKRMQAGQPDMVDAFRKHVTITGAGLTAEQKQKLFEVAGKCPVHRTLTGTISIETVDELLPA
jgi:putative redox protein